MPDFLSYVSAAKQRFSPEELRDLLTTCRAKNAALHITGALLYQDGNFMQLIEGEQSTVDALFRTIEADTRHQGVIVLLRGQTAEQQFSDWSMAFRDLTGTHDVLADGCSEYFSAQPVEAGGVYRNPTIGQRLLMSFRRDLLAQRP